MANLAPQELIPWEWAITPIDPETHVCPPVSQTLGVFGAINTITAILAAIIGNSKVALFLTCGRLGRENSKSYRWMWVVQVALMLGANAFNAWYTVSAEGYDQSRMPAIWDLTLFYVSRPRLNWLLLLLIPNLILLHIWNAQPSYSYRISSAERAEREEERAKGLVNHSIFKLYKNTIKQTLVSEMVLQLIGLYYKGRTANFARGNRFYIAHSLDGNPYQSDVLMMSVSALLYLICSVYALMLLMAIPDKTDKGNGTFMMVIIFYINFLSWIFTWLFISGFVRLAGNLYCPPNFTLQGIVWGVASILGVFLSSGF